MLDIAENEHIASSQLVREEAIEALGSQEHNLAKLGEQQVARLNAMFAHTLPDLMIVVNAAAAATVVDEPAAAPTTRRDTRLVTLSSEAAQTTTQPPPVVVVAAPATAAPPVPPSTPTPTPTAPVKTTTVVEDRQTLPPAHTWCGVSREKINACLALTRKHRQGLVDMSFVNVNWTLSDAKIARLADDATELITDDEDEDDDDDDDDDDVDRNTNGDDHNHIDDEDDDDDDDDDDEEEEEEEENVDGDEADCSSHHQPSTAQHQVPSSKPQKDKSASSSRTVHLPFSSKPISFKIADRNGAIKTAPAVVSSSSAPLFGVSSGSK